MLIVCPPPQPNSFVFPFLGNQFYPYLGVCLQLREQRSYNGDPVVDDRIVPSLSSVACTAR